MFVGDGPETVVETAVAANSVSRRRGINPNRRRAIV